MSVAAQAASGIPKISFEFVSEVIKEHGISQNIADQLSSYFGFAFILFVLGVGGMIIFGFTLILRDICCRGLCCVVLTHKSIISCAVANTVMIVIAIIAINLSTFGIAWFEKGYSKALSGIEFTNSFFKGANSISMDTFNVSSNLLELTAPSKDTYASSLPTAIEVCPANFEALANILSSLNEAASSTNKLSSYAIEKTNSYISSTSICCTAEFAV